MSFKLPTTEEKRDYVLDQFERIAKNYDLTNDAISLGMHRSWKHQAVDNLVNDASGKYLDVCCGTGDLALLIAERLYANGSVTGLDFSKNMLKVAKSRELKRREESRNLVAQVDWQEGDAQALPFADNSFDGAIISFGLRNLTDLPRGIKEMARVVKPGGKVINLDLGKATNPIFAPAFHLFFSYVVPVIGSLMQNDLKAYTYLPESLKTFPSPEKISLMFQEAGLKDVCHKPLALGSVAMHIGIKA